MLKWRKMSATPVIYKGHSPVFSRKNGGWSGKIAGLETDRPFEGETYEAAVEDFKRAVDAYLKAEADSLAVWLAREVEGSVLRSKLKEPI